MLPGPRSDDTVSSFQEATAENVLKRRYDQVAKDAPENCDLEIRKMLKEVATSATLGLTASEHELLVKLFTDQSPDGPLCSSLIQIKEALAKRI